MKSVKGKNPIITVLMSCYNGEKWISEAIESVLAQTFTSFEFIIVDDGSEDGSLRVIKKYAAKDNRIQILEKENSGLADSLNAGLKMATGSWIARIDADDICVPDRLEKQLNLAQVCSEVVFVGSGMAEIDEDGRTRKNYSYPVSHKELLRNLEKGHKFPPHSSAMIRIETLKQLGGYRKRLERAQDKDLWLRLSEIGELMSSREPLVKIRKHSGQISHDESGQKQILNSRMALISYYLRQMGVPDPVEANEDDFLDFKSWIASHLSIMKVYDFYSRKEELKRFIRGKKNMLPQQRSLSEHVTGAPRLIYTYLKISIFGETISRKLAAEWVQLQKNVK